MSLYQSPKIVTDGLVFYYDMNNRPKSFIGPPRTNYIPNPYASWNGSNFVLGYNYANLGATYTYRTDVQNPINAPGVLEYYTGTTGYKYFSVDSTAVPTTGTYTFSYYARLTNTSANNVNNSQLWRANGSDRSVSGDWNPTYTTTWRRYTTSGPIEAGTILQYFPIHSGSITGGYTIQFCGFQLEFDSYATPFVDGTRSTSDAVLDLTGRRTVSIGGSPTYGSDGSFTFNSSGSTTLNLGSGANFLPMPSLTLEAWIKTPGLGSGMSVNGIWGFTYGIRFNAASDGSLYFVIGTDVTTFVNIGTSGVNVNDKNWHHVVAVKNGDASCAIYVDGILRASGVPVAGWSGTNPWFAMEIQVGRDQNDAPYYFNGKIDSGRVYNRGLTASEVQQNYNAQRSKYTGYQTMTYTAISNVTLTNNGTQEVSMFKNADNAVWNGEVRSTEAFSAPCTIEFSKQAASGDNGASYAMIGWNEDPTSNTSYSSIDHASYPFMMDRYEVYNNGSYVNPDKTWDSTKRFYIVYDTDGFIRHYNGSTLLYSANYGTNKTVYFDCSLYSVNSTFGGFSNVKVARSSWNGTNYV